MGAIPFQTGSWPWCAWLTKSNSAVGSDDGKTCTGSIPRVGECCASRTTPGLPLLRSRSRCPLPLFPRACSTPWFVSPGLNTPRTLFLTVAQAVLRAPFACDWHHSSSSGSNDSLWSEVRNDLKEAMDGGILAQLVQELLLCCQQGEESSPPAANGAGASRRAVAASASPGSGGSGRARVWGGAEEARTAAGCLEALCSFTPGSAVWRRLLPGTFSGLFRTIRGIHSGRDVAGGMVLPSSAAQRGGDGRRRGSGSKSALAEVCLGTLAKVLLMCAGGDAAAVAAATGAATAGVSAARDPARVVKAGDGINAAVQSGTGGQPESRNSTDNDPLLALQRLAVTSNASARNPGNPAQPAGTASAAASPEGHHGSASLSPDPPPQPGAFAAVAASKTTSSAAVAASAAAAAATVIAVENPEWEARTSDRLRLLLPPLLAFCCLHPGWRVRRATAKLASDLLRAGGGGNEAASGGEAGRGRGEGKRGLLEPLTPLLMEALVGLLLDSMPQVGAFRRPGRIGLGALIVLLLPHRPCKGLSLFFFLVWCFCVFGWLRSTRDVSQGALVLS